MKKALLDETQRRPPNTQVAPKSTTAPKAVAADAPQPARGPPRHLDRRAHQIIAAAADEPDDQLLTPEDTAAWLGVSKMWLAHRRHFADGGPPFKRLSPKVIRYSRSEVKAWLETRRRTSTR